MTYRHENIHTVINFRAFTIKCEGYTRAYYAFKQTYWNIQNLRERMCQGDIGDGNYGKGQG